MSLSGNAIRAINYVVSCPDKEDQNEQDKKESYWDKLRCKDKRCSDHCTVCPGSSSAGVGFDTKDYHHRGYLQDDQYPSATETVYTSFLNAQSGFNKGYRVREMKNPADFESTVFCSNLANASIIGTTVCAYASYFFFFWWTSLLLYWQFKEWRTKKRQRFVYDEAIVRFEGPGYGFPKEVKMTPVQAKSIVNAYKNLQRQDLDAAGSKARMYFETRGQGPIASILPGKSALVEDGEFSTFQGMTNVVLRTGRAVLSFIIPGL